MTPLPRLGSLPLRRLIPMIPAAVLATALAAAPQTATASTQHAAAHAGHGPAACTGPAGGAFYVAPDPLPGGPHCRRWPRT